MDRLTRGIVVYLCITFGGTWGLLAVAWLLGMLGPHTGLVGQLAVVPAGFAPAAAAFVVRRWVTREGFADAGLRLQLRHAWPYYLFGWLLPLPVVGVIVLLAHAFAIPQVQPSVPSAIVASALVGSLVATPVFFGEEFGWRSYLQLRLFGGRQPLAAMLLTGLVWGVWHYPLILAGYEGYENRWLGLAIFPVFTILLAIIFGWLRIVGGSVWVTSLAHSAANGEGGSLTAYLFLGDTHFALVSYAGVLAWVPLGLVCVGLIVTQRRAFASPTGRSEGDVTVAVTAANANVPPIG
jgi:membrane protease YdiL (CAAX protease family)